MSSWIRLAAAAGMLLAGALPALPARAAETIETPASHALMIDHTTGAVMFAKAADEPMPPSSMSKLMTTYMLFERLSAGRLSLEDKFLVSEKAWRMGGSKMFVRVDDRVKVEDLIRGIVVQSGNDACVVVAEGLSGSEEAFAAEMNVRATDLGLAGSHFVNATGWPDDGHVMTAHDLARLAKLTIDTFPDYYHYYAEKEFEFAGIRQFNRNPLLYRYDGADGLKTGHTEAAGYGLTASAVRDGRRLILVLNGLESTRQRAREAVRLLDYGFRAFDNYRLFAAGDVVLEAAVWLGSADTVPLVSDTEVLITLAREARERMTVSVRFAGPIPAPITAGDEIATLHIRAPGAPDVTLPLRAGRNVRALSAFQRLGAAVGYLLWGPPSAKGG